MNDYSQMKATIKSKTTNVIECPGIEICRRCGASMQAKHHELCEARDGTTTDLDDATVRRLIRQEHPELRMYQARGRAGQKSGRVVLHSTA